MEEGNSDYIKVSFGSPFTWGFLLFAFFITFFFYVFFALNFEKYPEAWFQFSPHYAFVHVTIRVRLLFQPWWSVSALFIKPKYWQRRRENNWEQVRSELVWTWDLKNPRIRIGLLNPVSGSCRRFPTIRTLIEEYLYKIEVSGGTLGVLLPFETNPPHFTI